MSGHQIICGMHSLRMGVLEGNKISILGEIKKNKKEEMQKKIMIMINSSRKLLMRTLIK